MPVKTFNQAIAGLGLPDTYRDVLRLICQGYTNNAIARERETNNRQIENIVHRVREKLNLPKTAGVNTRIAIVNEMWKRGAS